MGLWNVIMFTLIISGCARIKDRIPKPAKPAPPQTSCSDQRSGTNRTPAGATKITLNGKDPKGSVDCNGGDQTDWYSVHIPETGTFTYHVRQKSGTTLFVEFYYSSQGAKAIEKYPLKGQTFALFGSDRCSFTTEKVRLGTYYAKVFVNNPGDTSTYEIWNTFQSERLEPEVDTEVDTRPIWTEDVQVKVQQENVFLTGMAQDDSEVEMVHISINGQKIDLKGDRIRPGKTLFAFEYTITEALQPGENIVTVKAIDQTGKESKIRELHIFFIQRPSLWFISASPGIRQIEEDHEKITIRGGNGTTQLKIELLLDEESLSSGRIKGVITSTDGFRIDDIIDEISCNQKECEVLEPIPSPAPVPQERPPIEKFFRIPLNAKLNEVIIKTIAEKYVLTFVRK
jgi:hypothetical protein